MPSRRHEFLAYALPRLRKSRDLDDVETERRRLERWHASLDRSLPLAATPGWRRRWSISQENWQVPGGPEFPAYVFAPRRSAATRTLFYVHGGGFVAPIDPFHVRYASRLAHALGARIVLPDYPLTPEHTWRDSFDALVEAAARWAALPGGIVLAGDSAGGGLALAVAIALRDRGLPQPTHLLLHAPWVDLTTSTPETDAMDAIDPWLFIGKLRAYAGWWSGADPSRPEVSPALAGLAGRPPALMFYGTRDLLSPGYRLLATRARESGWPLEVVEEPDHLHVYGILPTLPEARRARVRTLEFLR